MTLVVLMAGIDLSVGSVLAFTSVICAGLLKDGITIGALNIHVGFTIFGGILAAIVVGLLIGLFNGFVITKFSLPPLWLHLRCSL
jgi:ribose transport system permease protein